MAIAIVGFPLALATSTIVAFDHARERR
jgi:hypothetical protein